MKQTVINGHTYSKGSFDEYKMRTIVEIVTVDGEDHRLDVYTTNTDKEDIKVVVDSMKKEMVYSMNFVHFATKEQDDLSTKFINEWLLED